MKKSSFIAMVMGTIGGIFTSLGLCMCLQPEWNAFQPGVVMGCIGALILLATVIVWRILTRKDPVRMPARTFFGIILGAIGALTLGIGMCFAMMWGNMVFGIIIGIVGIFLLLMVIPLTKGIKK